MCLSQAILCGCKFGLSRYVNRLSVSLDLLREQYNIWFRCLDCVANCLKSMPRSVENLPDYLECWFRCL